MFNGIDYSLDRSFVQNLQIFNFYNFILIVYIYFAYIYIYFCLYLFIFVLVSLLFFLQNQTICIEYFSLSIRLLIFF